MNEQFQFQGMWWLPDGPEAQVPGTLKFDPDDGVTLDLLGSFKKDLQDLGTFLEPKLILGFSSDGKSITLRNCFETQTKMGMPGMVTSSFHADMVLVGAHFEEENEVAFEKISVEYLHLDEWAHTSGFVLKIPDDHKAHPMVIEQEHLDSITVSVGDAQISLKFRQGFEASNPLVRWAKLTQTAYFTVEYPERKPLDDHVKVVYDLQNFLSLGVGEAVYPLAVQGRTNEDERWVDIYYRPLGRLSSAEKVHSVKMRFTLPDLEDNFGQALCNWLVKVEALDPVYQLYFGTMYNPQAYLRHQFVSLVQALEAYHRRAMGTLELPEEEHLKRMEEILDAVPEEHRDWLGEKLKYSNEPGLRKRLREIFDRCPEAVAFVFGSRKKDRKGLIHKIWATRNYLTHYDKGLKYQAAREEELYRVSRKLKSLVEICLLNELGFEDGQIVGLLKRKPQKP